MSKKNSCSEYLKCLKISRLMLDNEATLGEEEYFSDHIDVCHICYQEYELEKQIREVLKAKIVKLPIPMDLASTIKKKISNSY